MNCERIKEILCPFLHGNTTKYKEDMYDVMHSERGKWLYSDHVRLALLFLVARNNLIFEKIKAMYKNGIHTNGAATLSGL